MQWQIIFMIHRQSFNCKKTSNSESTSECTTYRIIHLKWTKHNMRTTYQRKLIFRGNRDDAFFFDSRRNSERSGAGDDILDGRDWIWQRACGRRPSRAKGDRFSPHLSNGVGWLNLEIAAWVEVVCRAFAWWRHTLRTSPWYTHTTPQIHEH